MFRASQGFQRTFRMYERREALVRGGGVREECLFASHQKGDAQKHVFFPGLLGRLSLKNSRDFVSSVKVHPQ